METLKRWSATILLILLMLNSTGCVGTVISLTTDAAIEVAKVPFKVGGAVVDVISDDEDDEDDEEE